MAPGHVKARPISAPGALRSRSATRWRRAGLGRAACQLLARAARRFGQSAARVLEIGRLVLGNRFFLGRLETIGVMSAEDAISLGWTGPCLRASGVPYDVRKAHPYVRYGEVDFEVPVGATGDCLDRVIVRFEELKQSVRIIDQSLQRMPDEGSIGIEDPKVTLPPKQDVYTTIEGTIQHSKIIMEGIKLPAGEVYGYTEAATGSSDSTSSVTAAARPGPNAAALLLHDQRFGAAHHWTDVGGRRALFSVRQYGGWRMRSVSTVSAADPHPIMGLR
jgi:NADH:ubiquinone oxidoreductase subunit D